LLIGELASLLLSSTAHVGLLVDELNSLIRDARQRICDRGGEAGPSADGPHGCMTGDHDG
ncbi:MAG: hypothetical protein WAN24_04325, partial [Candidatus Acidiferrales bacterium]